VQQRLTDRKITLKYTDKAVSLLGSLGYNPAYGARPVKRVIQSYVENEISKSILRGDFNQDDVILLDTEVRSSDSQEVFVLRKSPAPVGSSPEKSEKTVAGVA
jgi:ATP-dependent Clp protease ATP-binding subunit ClpB